MTIREQIADHVLQALSYEDDEFYRVWRSLPIITGFGDVQEKRVCVVIKVFDKLPRRK